MATQRHSVGYVTFKNKKQAEHICSILLQEKLIACANIFKPHTAMYVWKKKTVRSLEVAAIIKTRKTLEKKLTQRIKTLHTYEVPCVVFWPLSTKIPAFTDWIHTSTAR